MKDIIFLVEEFNKYGIKLSDEQINLFSRYFDILIEYNNNVNLTAITEWKEVVVKHFVDSVIPNVYIKSNSTVVDIGAGAGFPSIPLKIVRDDLKITMVDSLDKRIKFLNKAIFELNLNNIEAIHSRAEDYAKTHREQFDYVVARAVASMNILSEYCLPLVKIGGQFVAYKGDVDKELSESEYAIDILGGKLDKCVKYALGEYERSVVIVNKVSHTPAKYPRGQNKPRISPIGTKN